MSTDTLRQKAPDFITRSEDPFTGGPAPEHLLDPVTPYEHFFVRDHTANPTIDAATHTVSVRALDGTEVELRMDDLATLSRHEVTATLQCAGNRRSGLFRVRDVPGEVPWGDEAVSTALWSGWRLRDVLVLAGVEADAGGAHIETVGSDLISKPDGAINFGGSIPAAKAYTDDVLLADRMNGEALRVEHGHPLRLVVPGYIGARSTKWVTSIAALAEPSDNFYQRAYSVYPEHMTREDHDPAAGMPLAELPVNSVTCVPAPGAVTAGRVRVAGWATAGDDRHITRVEVSVDGGATWTDARFRDEPRPFVWALWELDVELAAGAHELVVRATDSAGTMQPDDPAPLWNFKGYMNNAWHRTELQAH